FRRHEGGGSGRQSLPRVGLFAQQCLYALARLPGCNFKISESDLGSFKPFACMIGDLLRLAELDFDRRLSITKCIGVGQSLYKVPLEATNSCCGALFRGKSSLSLSFAFT